MTGRAGTDHVIGRSLWTRKPSPTGTFGPVTGARAVPWWDQDGGGGERTSDLLEAES
ncbi:hypothetical protein SALBM217S_06799 [Streptomyces griseoloalbus]